MNIEFLSDINFYETIKNKDISLIYFYTSWCGYCKMMDNIIKEISNEYPNLFVGKVNVDFELEIKNKLNINTIPILIIFKNGIEIIRNTGFVPKDKIISLLEI